jgi:hypothetical protein
MRRHDELIAKGFVPLGKAKSYRDGPLAQVKEKRGGTDMLLPSALKLALTRSFLHCGDGERVGPLSLTKRSPLL